MIDLVVLGLVLLSAIFGLIRGVVSQVMALAGLVAAYYMAPWGGDFIGGWVQQQLGCSRFMAEKTSIFFFAFFIYALFRIVGYGIEKLFIGRVRELKSLNRFGGATLGALKGVVIVSVLLFFLTLVPKPMVLGWFPKLPQSYSYQLAARYNPMGEQKVLERMRGFRGIVRNSKQKDSLTKDITLKNILSKYELPHALQDRRFMKSLEDGDYDQLQHHEKIEELMKDDQLGELLAKLDQKKSS